MSVQLGSAVGYVDIDPSGVRTGVAQANQALAGIGAQAALAGAALTAGVTVPLIRVGSEAIKTGAEFEAQMNILGVAARSSGTSMEELSKAAMLVGKDTQLVGINSAQAALALTNFYKAGLDTSEIFGGQLNPYLETGTNLVGALRSAIDLATASELSLDDASMLVASAMATFGLGAEDAARITNSFVGAADASLASVEDLALAMQNIGPTAAQFGWSIEETNTALAILSTRGIMGAEAGTALKSMMVNLMRPTDDVKETLAALNVALYDSQGNMLPLPNIIGQLSTAMSGLTEEQRNQVIQTLAGSYGMKAMGVLLAEGTPGWNEMAAAIGAAATAQEVGAARTQGLKTAWEQLQGTLETLYLTVGLPIIQNFLTPLVRIGTDAIAVLVGLSPQVHQAAVAFLAVLAAAGPVLLAVKGISLVLGALTGPIGLVILAVAALAAAWAADFGGIRTQIGATVAHFVTQGELLTDYFTTVPIPVQDALATILLAVDSTLTAIQAFAQTALENTRSIWEGTWTIIRNTVQTALGYIQNIVASVLGIVQDFIGEHGDEIQTTLLDAWTSISSIVNTAAQIVEGLVTAVFGGISRFLDTHGEDIKGFLSSAWTFIRTVIETALDIIQGVLRAVLAVMQGDWKGAWDAVKGVADNVWKLIKTIIEAALGIIKGLVVAYLTQVKASWETTWKIISSVTESIWSGIKTKITNALATIKSTVSTVLEAIKAVFAAIWAAIVTTVVTKLAEIYTAVTTKIQAIKTWIAGFSLADAGRALIQGMINGVTAMAGALIAAATGVVSSAIQAAKNLLGIHSPSTVFAEMGRNIIEGLIEGMDEEKAAAAAKVADAVATIVQAAVDAAQALQDFKPVDNLGVIAGQIMDFLLGVETQFQALVALVDQKLADEAAALAEALGKVVGVFGEALGFIGELRDLIAGGAVITNSASLPQPLIFLKNVLRRLAELMQELMVDPLLANLDDEFVAFNERLQSVVGPFAEAVGFISDLRDLVAGGEVVTNSETLAHPLVFLKNALRRMAELLTELRSDPLLAGLDNELVAFSGRLTAVVGPFAEVLGFVGDLRDLVAGGEVVTNSESLPQPLVFLRNVLRRMAELLAELKSDPLLAGLDNELVAFSGRLTAVVGPFAEVLGFVGDLRDLVAGGEVVTNSESLPQPLVFLRNVLRRMAELLAELKSDPLLAGLDNEMVAFAERLQGITGVWSEVLGFMQALADYAGPEHGVIDLLVSDVVYMVAALNFAAAALTDTALARALAIAEVGREIYTALADGIAAASGIGEGSGVGGLAQAMDQLTTAVSDAVTAILAQFMLLIDAAGNAGYGFVNSLSLGIMAGLPLLEAALQAVADLFPHSPAKAGPLRRLPDWRAWMMAGMGEAAGAVSARLAAPAAGAGESGLLRRAQEAAGPAQLTINLNNAVIREELDISRIAQAVGAVFAGDAHVNMRMNTGWNVG